MFSELQVVEDVSVGKWLTDRLWPRETGRVGAFVPEGYPAYGRLLHPARSVSGPERWRWSAIAARRGVSIGAEVNFRALTDWRDGPEPPAPYLAPNRGSLEAEDCLVLADVLAKSVGQSQKCWYCLWDGYGLPDLPAPREGPPRLHLEHEDCLLFTGPLRSVMNFRSEGWFQSPTVWWSDDRAWCISTPVESFSTYIAGSEALLNALTSESKLEVLPIGVDEPVDPSPYPEKQSHSRLDT